MLATRTLRELPFEEALAAVDAGAAFVDLREVDAYLEVHIPGSLSLLYEQGPGLASRARDCLPLDLALVLVDLGGADYVHAAASLRGKGFTVLGRVGDAINRWASVRGVPASTEIVRGTIQGSGLVLDVGDFGAPGTEEAVRIPIEELWRRVEELPSAERVAVTSGYGVRAALAVGILERTGVEEILLWRGAR
jgi:rhodanese-related sulfurtransferase